MMASYLEFTQAKRGETAAQEAQRRQRVAARDVLRRRFLEDVDDRLQRNGWLVES